VPPASNKPSRLLTVREVVERLGVCRATHSRISNAVRIEAEALERFIREPSSWLQT
jgi:Trp operon repressor